MFFPFKGTFFTVLFIFQSLILSSEPAKLEEITLTTEDGVSFSAFKAGPEDGEKAVLLVHDWFGVSDFYKEAAEKLGKAGYLVLAIDYYGGFSGLTHKEAYSLMQAMDPAATKAKVAAALKTLKKKGRSIATFGFSLGTEFAYRAALQDDGVNAVVLWYGFSPVEETDITFLKADVLNIQGSLDGPAAETGKLYLEAMDKAGKRGELFIYPQAHHAFAQPLFNAGKTYDPAGASAAWAITLNFLERKLGSKTN